MSTVPFEKAKWQQDAEGFWLSVKVKDKRTAGQACQSIEEKKANVLSFEREYEKRTNDANRYCWTLLEKLARELEIPKEEIYREQVKYIPQKASKVLVKTAEVEEEIKVWEKGGLGWYADVMGESKEHKGYTWIDRFKGSSSFDKKQMSLLIDNIICECKEFDIETRTPEQIAKMISLWGEKE